MTGKTTSMPILDNKATDDNKKSATQTDGDRIEVEDIGAYNPVTFDELGDLHLHAGATYNGKPSTFIVCSRTLARASPVFKKMLFGNFAESRASRADKTDWSVELPDDKPGPLRYLLHIMHGNFRNIPRTAYSFDLFGTIALADKYDCIDIFRPWASTWSNIPESDCNDGYLLYIGWELGDIALVKRMAVKIANECTVSQKGKIIYDFSTGSRTLFGPKVVGKKDLYEALGNFIPTSIIDQIVELRGKLVDTEMKPYHAIYESLKQYPRCKHGVASCPTDVHTDCDLLLLGSLVKGFFKIPIELGSAKPSTSYKGSAKELRKHLQNLQLSVGGQSKLFVHESCYTKVNMERLRGYLEADDLRKEGIKIGQDHQSRIERQGMKTGVV